MYKALNYWVFGGFGPNRTPYEFVDFAAAQGLDGIEMTVGNCLVYAPAQDYVEILGAKYIKAVHIKNWQGEDCGGTLHGFGDSLLAGEVDYKAVFAALAACGYERTFTVEMIPFSRLPDLVLPDQALAEKSVKELKELCA